jgi:hypothetical protein
VQQFLHDNWTYLAGCGAIVAASIGWILTVVGWARVHRNNLAIETKKFEAGLKLEREKFRASLNLDKKRAELKFVSDQIQLLYGPLFSLGNASELAFGAFMKLNAHGRTAFFDGTERSSQELANWRTWISAVMMPLNLRMEQAIIENSHLIDGPSMPEGFQDFLSHVASYKAVLRKWEDAKSDRSIDQLTEADHTPVMNFPRHFHEHIRTTFSRLRAQQLELLSVTEDTGAVPFSED